MRSAADVQCRGDHLFRSINVSVLYHLRRQRHLQWNGFLQRCADVRDNNYLRERLVSGNGNVPRSDM